jgi:hypothetical protein
MGNDAVIHMKLELRLHSRLLYLLLMRDPKTIRLSSMREIISEVLSPRNKSSPRFLKLAKANSRRFQSAMTPFNFASISFSFVAAMQIS